MKYFKKILPLVFTLSIAVLITPTFAFAADPMCAEVASGVKNIGQLFTLALCILDDTVIPFLVAIGLVIFLAGVIRFVGAGDNEEKRQGGRELMVFGLIALFVMVSVWGFVNIISQTIFGGDAQIQSLPKKATSVFES